MRTRGVRDTYDGRVWYTELQHCRRCGVWGSPRKVTYRYDCYRLDYLPFAQEPVLCVSCWAKVRRTIVGHYVLDELQLLANRIRRASYERKDPHNRKSA